MAKLGAVGRRQSNESMRLVITTIIGVVVGFLIGISFPAVSITKLHFPSSIISYIEDNNSGITTQALLNRAWTSANQNKNSSSNSTKNANEESKAVTKANSMKAIKQRMEKDIDEVGKIARLAKSKVEELDRDDPDLVVEAIASTSSSQSARPSTRTSATEDNIRPRTSTPGTTNSLRLDKKTIQFSVNAWVLAVAFFGVLPLVPMTLVSKAYQLSLIGKALLSFYSLYTLYGKPRAWNMPSIQAWLQSVIVAKDFIHFIYCILLVSSQTRFKFALIPVICWSLEHVAKFLRLNFAGSLLYRKYLEEFCAWINANITTLNILSSNAEVALGFLLIFSLFSWQRNILQTFMYWQLLKLMYHVPATAGYHQSVWNKIGRTISPYIHQHAPFLNSPISAAQRWWFR